MRACVSAGEALPESLRNDWKAQTGLTIANGFGASETLSLVLFNAGKGHSLVPSPGVDLRAVSENVNGMPTRVRIGGSMVALGYWNRPDAQAEHFHDGTFCPATPMYERRMRPS